MGFWILLLSAVLRGSLRLRGEAFFFLTNCVFAVDSKYQPLKGVRI